MHDDPAEIRKHIRTYLMIGAALFVGTAITVALIIAITKGSMVASVFMHLSNEKKWIYGALLLTVLFWIVLMSVPLFTQMDNIGTPIGASNPSHAEPPRH